MGTSSCSQYTGLCVCEGSVPVDPAWGETWTLRATPSGGSVRGGVAHSGAPDFGFGVGMLCAC